MWRFLFLPHPQPQALNSAAAVSQIDDGQIRANTAAMVRYGETA